MRSLVGIWILQLGSMSSAVYANEGAFIVQNGRPRAVIVVMDRVESLVAKIGLDKANPVEPVDKIAWAARDLQYYVAKISGAELPIYNEHDSLPPDLLQIFVGCSKKTAQ